MSRRERGRVPGAAGPSGSGGGYGDGGGSVTVGVVAVPPPSPGTAVPCGFRISLNRDPSAVFISVTGLLTRSVTVLAPLV